MPVKIIGRRFRCSPLITAAVLSLVVSLLFLFSARGTDAALPLMQDGDGIPTLAPMIERVTPAVVNIATEGRIQLRRNPLFDDPFFRRFFGIPDQPQERKTQSLGSGVIIDAKRGLVVTNNHVIANADQITVKLWDGRKLDAELVGTDPDTDVAVVKIPAENLTDIPIANSDELRVGDFVVAIGNPFGLDHTVTSGIVSALARTGLGIGNYEDYIQTDASINPGNSGGALVNLKGELVGINTAIFSQSGGNIGIGFAIPSAMAKQITEQLVEHGEVRRGFIGAQLQNLDPDLAEAFGGGIDKGAVLVDIAPGSPAEKAGLKAGDVIISVNGKPVDSAADVRNRVGLLQVGDKVSLEIMRNGKRKRVTATVEERKSDALAGNVHNSRLAGATFGEIDERHPLYGKTNGVLVYEVERGSSVWRAGLREGDIILSVNRMPVQDMDDFLKIVNEQKGSLLLQVRRGNAAAFMVIK